MGSFFNKVLEKFTKAKYYLILANLLLVFFLILLSNTGILPMRLGDFVFFSLVYLIFALYRPGWSFLFFVGTIMLENVNLAPESLGIFIRPYQVIGALTIISLVFRYFTKRLNFELVKLRWFDFVVFVFGFSGVVSSLFAESKGVALKQSMILITFIALYWLVRNYIQTLEDVKRIAPFFLSSSLIVVLYGILQNIRFMRGLNSFEAIPGRPNGTFTEADWLGVCLTLVVAVVYSIIYYLNISANERRSLISNSPNYLTFPPQRDPAKAVANKIPGFKFSRYGGTPPWRWQISSYLLYIFLIPVYILLALTVSRSAWLGVGFITLVFLKAIFTNFSFRARNWNFKEFLKHLSFVAGTMLLSVGFVYVFHLTNFQLLNRAQSAGSGLQKITVACSGDVQLPEKIGDVSELEKYDCRHINLEDIDKEKSEGNFVMEVYRTDPNVNVRAMIYQKSWGEIRKHPIFGVGWGNISNVLGKDEKGAGLNSSNIFLEVWLGSGILGLLAFLIVWVYIFLKSVVHCVRESFESKAIGVFLVLGFFAMLIPNLFNAGTYLGILWIWFAESLSLSRTNSDKA